MRQSSRLRSHCSLDMSSERSALVSMRVRQRGLVVGLTREVCGSSIQQMVTPTKKIRFSGVEDAIAQAAKENAYLVCN